MRPVRAGESHLVWNDPRLAAPRLFALSSPAFADGRMMPKRSAGSGVGDNLSPRSTGPEFLGAQRSSC
jgi:hypothetical protein